MSLHPGARIGPYEVVAAIGAGGMGEVYRGRDTRLQRDVAIKILPDMFARDPERLARFEREARTLAALNHPNIAQVYGVEGSALIMEFVDGDDLSARITRSGAIPLDEALPIALQIAEALEAAHEQGIVHRDLKPANVKIRPDGAVKVLDFGLAKAIAPPGPSGGPPAMENSPTITSPFQLSALGLILGTAAYMAPEQAKGRAVDKRADIWAFGCVLYEMLTGRRPFTGEDVTDTLAAIVRADPDWSSLPPDTPLAVRTLVRRCLVKDRRERLPDIGAARLDLKDAIGTAVAAPARDQRAVRPRVPPWTIAPALLLLMLAVAIGVWMRRDAGSGAPLVASIVPPGPLIGAPALRLALSPDGRSLALVAQDASGVTMLWVRRLDDERARAIPGTRNASSPFWSPDSRTIAFFADGKLRRVDAIDGPPLTICDSIVAPPGAWGRDGTIYITGPSGPLLKVPATGGTTSRGLDPTPGVAEVLQQSPFMLPDQKHVLYTAAGGGSRAMGIYAASPETRKVTPIVDAASNAAYAGGHLFYLRGTTLLAQPFDPVALRFIGSAVPVATDLQVNPSTGTGAFSVSDAGVLVYQKGASAGTQLVWMDRKGTRLGTLGKPGLIRDVQLSPDGLWASATVPDEGNGVSHVWLFDLVRNAARPFTFGAEAFAAVWSADSRRLAYSVRRSATAADLMTKDVSGRAEPELLLRDEATMYPLGYAHTRLLLFAVLERASSGHAALLPLDGGRTPAPLNLGGANQLPAEVSPDGRWLAYVSDESGRSQVYVKAFPSLTGKWQVSTDGGFGPRWRGDGQELFFAADDHFQSVEVGPSREGFDATPPRLLFDVRLPAPTLGLRSTYAVAPGGQKFLFDVWDPSAALTPITLVVNWPATLKR